jgi:tetrahydromethanopterin S-methyltransferase subunit D
VSDDDEESTPERLDRELTELTQELRVLLPGVQVLFAFLLTVPFSVGFDSVTGAERALYFAALSATTVSAVLLIAPSARHRARFRDRDKEAIIVSSNQLTLASTAFLAIAMVSVVVLVGDYLYGWTVGVCAGLVTFALIAWFWYGWSLARRIRRGS